MKRSAVTAVVGILLLRSIAGQSPSPSVRILSPRDGSYLSGDTVIRAVVEPVTTAVERMEFFADARLICRVAAPPFECAWNAGPMMHEHTIRVVAYLVGGHRVAATVRTREVEYQESVKVEMVQVTVVVLDGAQFVRGLPKSAFRVYEDGVRQPIGIFESENAELELVAAVDISDSMTLAIDQVKEIVKRFLSALRPTDRVKVVAFNENRFMLPARDLPGRLKAVDNLAPWGKTALHDTMIWSFDLLGTRPGRRGMIVFTDGADTASSTSAAAVERRADSSDAVLYMIGQGQAMDSEELRQLCQRLAKKSGGRAFFPRQIESLDETFDQIREELANQYFLTYAPPVSDDKWHEIRVEVGDGRYQVRAREGRQAASAQ